MSREYQNLMVVEVLTTIRNVLFHTSKCLSIANNICKEHESMYDNIL